MTQEQPSPGALRAAEAIQMEYFEEVLTIPRTIHLAAIIDRETAAADLLAALKWFVEQITDGTLVRDISKDHEPEYNLRMMKFVQQLNETEAAIAKAKGKKS